MILLTGAGGTVGSVVVQALKGSQAKLRLAFRTEEKAAQARQAGYEALAFDYTQSETLAPAFEGVEKLFLLGTGILGQQEGELNLLRAAQAACVRKIVKLSVLGAEREDFALARLHRAVEREIEASGLEWTFLRANNFMQGFVVFDGETIRSEGMFYQANASAPVAHVDVRDIADLAAHVLLSEGHAGKAYNLSGPQALNGFELAAIMSHQLGKQVECQEISGHELHAHLLAAGAPPIYADTLVDLYDFFGSGGAANSDSALSQLLGRPAISFEQFVRDYAALLR
jgi:uncharacterized protein YbjT (DUF2867 family)